MNYCTIKLIAPAAGAERRRGVRVHRTRAPDASRPLGRVPLTDAQALRGRLEGGDNARRRAARRHADATGGCERHCARGGIDTRGRVREDADAERRGNAHVLSSLSFKNKPLSATGFPRVWMGCASGVWCRLALQNSRGWVHSGRTVR